jgi:hypothetical protein
MKSIKLYDWFDINREHVVREVQVLKTDDLTRNGKQRIFVWSGEGEEFNYILYPQYSTAYPEYEYRIQNQRIAQRYYYEAVE